MFCIYTLKVFAKILEYKSYLLTYLLHAAESFLKS